MDSIKKKGDFYEGFWQMAAGYGRKGFVAVPAFYAGTLRNGQAQHRHSGGGPGGLLFADIDSVRAGKAGADAAFLCVYGLGDLQNAVPEYL